MKKEKLNQLTMMNNWNKNEHDDDDDVGLKKKKMATQQITGKQNP